MLRVGHTWGNELAHSSFVGRARELSVLEQNLAAAERAQGAVVFVGGEPGIGKTRLLREVAESATAAGRAVLAGRSHVMQGSAPYLPFIEVLGQHLRATSDDELAELASSAPELCMLLPELAARFPVEAPRPTLGPDADRYRLFEAVSELVIGISRREPAGLVVLLDDLQWADSTTLLLLQHLARKIASERVMVVVAYRATDLTPGHPLIAILADLTRDQLCVQLRLQPLSESETAALIERLTGAPAAPGFTSRLHGEATGNPFFIQEMVRDLLERGSDLTDVGGAQTIPESVRHVIVRRLGRLSPATNETLQTAAVIGDSFGFRVLSAASALQPGGLTEAIEEAERAGMIREENDGHVFTHGLIRRALYDELSLPRRWQLHERIANALEAQSPGLAYSNLAIIAHHWRLGGHPERATNYLLRAGDEALALTAWDEAARHWEFALQCMEKSGESLVRRARLLEGLGDLYFLSSFEAQPSVERYLRAAALYESAGETVSGARARSRAGRSLAYPTSGFDYPGALEHLHAAETVLRNEPESLELGEIYAAIAHAESHALLHGPQEMLILMRRVSGIAEQLNDEFLRDFLEVQSLHLQGHYLGLQGRLAEGLALETRAFETAAAMRGNPGATVQWPGRWQESLLTYSREAEPGDANAMGSPHMAKFSSRAGLANFTRNCAGWQSMDLYDPVQAREKHEGIRDGQGRFITPFLFGDLFLCGDVAELRRLVEGGMAVISSANPDAIIRAHVMLAFAEGRWAELRADFNQTAERFRKGGSDSLTLASVRWLLRQARVTGDVDAAMTLADEALAISLRSGAVKYEFIVRAELALLQGENGRRDEAEANLVRCREILADGEDWRGIRGRLALAEAVVAAACGRAADSEFEFQRALDVFRRLTLPWDEAEAFGLWAKFGRRFHRGSLRQTFIAEKLAEARAVYERIGAGQPWLDRLNSLGAELEADGAQPRRQQLPDGLTAREYEVLGLVASGRSSREIGIDLVLSVRTVERHVANIYLKTGTHGRAQLATYAVAHGFGVASE